MTVDLTGPATARAACAYVIAAIAVDELAAERIECLLEDDGMEVHAGDLGDRELDVEDGPDALVGVFGRGITERDQQMRRLRKQRPDAPLVAVIPQDSRRGVRRALEAGADGVVFDVEVEVALALTVRAVMAGQTVVPAARRHEVDRPTLSAREKQVLRMVVTGMSNKAIAAQLFLAESTVKCHLSSAFSKLGVRSRNEAADLILNSGAVLGMNLSFTPPAHATTEGSIQ